MFFSLHTYTCDKVYKLGKEINNNNKIEQDNTSILK